MEPFYLSRRPVSVREYAASLGSRADDDAPARVSSWRDAVAYSGWYARVSGKPIRLPLVTEWNHAARGDHGLFEMDSGVWEWCTDGRDGGPTLVRHGAEGFETRIVPEGTTDLACRFRIVRERSRVVSSPLSRRPGGI